METISNYTWIVIVLFLIWICYRLWKAGKYREPDKNIYEKELRKKKQIDELRKMTDSGNPILRQYKCPYDINQRSCKHMNTATGYLDVQCSDCNWYNDGVRPSKF